MKLQNIGSLAMKQDIKFLIVDDSISMRKIIINSLKILGYESIVEAENGNDAFTKLTSENPEFILADWNVSSLSGSKFIRTVRNNEKFKTIPILMLTSRGMEQDILAATKVNVNSFIIRPITPQILQNKINQILN
jgi:two-component system chemotaxis response regulator CheY